MTDRDLGADQQTQNTVDVKPVGDALFKRTIILNPNGRPNRIRLERIDPLIPDIGPSRDIPHRNVKKSGLGNI